MKKNSFAQKRIIHMYIIIFAIVMLILFSIALMLKYSVEGEKNLPFNLKKINIISTAENNLTQDEDETWHASILQKNNIYLVIEKNSEYKKNEAIKSIKLENFKIKKENDNFNISIYRPTSSANEYTYDDEYKIENTLEYTGELSTNTENLQINNQGGVIGISVISENIGEYSFLGDEKIPGDGKILNKAGIKLEDIKFNLSFDLIIETSNNQKFKAEITLELPTGDIAKEGVGTLEDTTLDNVVFKRI